MQTLATINSHSSIVQDISDVIFYSHILYNSFISTAVPLCCALEPKEAPAGVALVEWRI